MQILLKKRYVVGIIFDDQNNVLLINKLRPDTQKGMLNGIGGKIEKNGKSFPLNKFCSKEQQKSCWCNL